jgi:hypothetical protein
MYVSVHNYQKGQVEIYQYDDNVEDVEQWVYDKVGHADFEWMTMSELKLIVNPDID